MHKSELDSILKKARLPQPPKEFWEEFPQQIVRGLNQARTKSYHTERNWFPRLAWGFATAICILAAFAIGHWRGRVETETSRDVLANAKVVDETLAMFPNRVRAIIQDEHGLQLVLSDQPNVPMSTPLWVKICDGKQCSSLVTFSGQELAIAGQKITVLSDAQGGIILEGNQFVWSSSARNFASGNLKIEAKSLSSITL
jgi:hypothetical protein